MSKDVLALCCAMCAVGPGFGGMLPVEAVVAVQLVLIAVALLLAFSARVDSARRR